MGAASARRLVLIVEDEGPLRSAIVSEFQRSGWEVLEASTAEGALVLLEDHAIDVVFTDIQLGGHLSGWDLAEAIRGARPHTPVVYTSGTTVGHSRMVPGSRFIAKPYQAQAVLDACHQQRHAARFARRQRRRQNTRRMRAS
jgi:DNA-binding NtrC family response regulator